LPEKFLKEVELFKSNPSASPAGPPPD